MPDSVDRRFSISVDVSRESTEQLIGAISDAFSPATEFLGAIGDKIRIYRTKVALKVLEETRRLARRQNVKLSAPPLKFLVPFLEKASLEEEGSDLTRRWAALLLSSARDFDEGNLVFIDVLSQIGPIGAKTIKMLGSRVDVGEAEWPGLRFQLEEVREGIGRWFRDFVYVRQNFPGENFDSSEFRSIFEKKPILITDLGQPIEKYPSVIGHRELSYTFGFNVEHGLALERLGLLRRGSFSETFCRRDGRFVSLGDGEDVLQYPFEIGFAALTPFGFRFYQRCEAPLKGSNNAKGARRKKRR
jgi:hypothetical protein